jgi:diguanylate cyclase (GGDEF)-like protein/PAS domain S-box-containing protein
MFKQSSVKQIFGRLKPSRRILLILAFILLVFCAAVIQYFQLRADLLADYTRGLESTGRQLEEIMEIEITGLKDLADDHALGLFKLEKDNVLLPLESVMERDASLMGYTVNRINPYVSFSEMGTLFGGYGDRIDEPSYNREMQAVLDRMPALKTLKNHHSVIMKTFYYSHRNMVAVQPWTEVRSLLSAHRINTFKELYQLFQPLVAESTKTFNIYAVHQNPFDVQGAIVLSQSVQQEQIEHGIYGAVLDLNELHALFPSMQVQQFEYYFFVDDKVLVRWDQSGIATLPVSEWVNADVTGDVGSGSSRSLEYRSVLGFGVGMDMPAFDVLKSVLPKMWVYLAVIAGALLFITIYEAIIYARYFKPAMILSQLLNDGEVPESTNEFETSDLWKPVYERIKEYFDLVSISRSLSGAIIQIEKNNDKYSIRYASRGLDELVKDSTATLTKTTDFLQLFEPNSYWNLENLLRDSQTYRIPIEYEAALNTEDEEKTFVSVMLKPKIGLDDRIYWEGLILDVTDRKLLERELNEEKRFIEKLFELSGALFAVLDVEMSIVRCNRSFMQLFATTSGEGETYPSLKNLFSSFDYTTFKDQFNRVLEGAVGGVLEHYWQLPDGRRKLVKTTIAPMRSTIGMVEYVILTAIDISDRFKIEEELKKTNQNLYIQNAQIERNARIQRELFKTFEELRNVENLDGIYDTVSKIVSQITSSNNYFIAMRVDRVRTDVLVRDLKGHFEKDSYANYFHYYRGVLGRVLLSRIPYMTGNVQSDPDYIMHDVNVRSVIYIPITYNQFLWGIIGVDSYIENAFSKSDFEVLNVLGSHLGLYMEELHNRRILLEEADRLRGLHHVMQDISALRNNVDIAQRIVENGLFKHLAIFKTRANGDYDLIAESSPSSYELYGIMPNYAILDHALSKNKMINGRIGALNVYHLANPVMIEGEHAGIVYSIKDYEFSTKDEELIRIISEQMAVFWRLNGMMDRANHDAMIDPLTGIWNRRYMIDRLNEENSRLKRYHSQSPAAIAIIDLGEFKAINDTYGHNIGDEVLVGVALDFADNIRDSDIVGRYGGDEFIIFMPNTNHRQGDILLERITEVLLEKTYGSLQMHIHLDYGIATVPEDHDDIFEALKVADERMYKHKKERKAAMGQAKS